MSSKYSFCVSISFFLISVLGLSLFFSFLDLLLLLWWSGVLEVLVLLHFLLRKLVDLPEFLELELALADYRSFGFRMNSILHNVNFVDNRLSFTLFGYILDGFLSDFFFRSLSP